MKIAVLAWGSLLWEDDTEFDQWHGPWQYDGPALKLEFSRVSQSRLGALTLVIDADHGCSTTVAWCLSKRSDPDDAIADLRCREGTTMKNIGWLFLKNNKCSQFRDKDSQDSISAWAKRKKLDVVVWTDLPSNFEERVKQAFSVTAALSYIKTLGPDAKVKAIEYIWQAPDFVKTPLRTALQQEPWF